MVSTSPSRSSREFVERTLDTLPSADRLIGRPSGELTPALLIELFVRTRHYSRDGLVRLLVRADTVADWEAVAVAADTAVLSLTPDNAARLVDLTHERGAIRMLLGLRRVYQATGRELMRRFGQAPVGREWVRLREEESGLGRVATERTPSAFAPLLRLVRPRRVTAGETSADAAQRALEALCHTWQSVQMPAMYEGPTSTPFQQIGLPPAPTGWAEAADQFLDEEIRWALADHFPAVAGALDRGAGQGRKPFSVYDAERMARRAAGAQRRRGVISDESVENLPDPTPRARTTEQEAAISAMIAGLRRRYPSKAWRALDAYRAGHHTKEEAAKVGGVSVKALDALIARVRPVIPPEFLRT